MDMSDFPRQAKESTCNLEFPQQAVGSISEILGGGPGLWLGTTVGTLQRQTQNLYISPLQSKLLLGPGSRSYSYHSTDPGGVLLKILFLSQTQVRNPRHILDFGVYLKSFH